MKRGSGFTLIELLVVITIVGILVAAVNTALGGTVTQRNAEKFPDTLATMLASLGPLALAKQEPVVLRHSNGYVYVALEATSGVPATTRVAVPKGVTIDTANTVLARADASGVVSAPDNPLHLIVNGKDYYLYISISGDVEVSNSLSQLVGGEHAG